MNNNEHSRAYRAYRVCSDLGLAIQSYPNAGVVTFYGTPWGVVESVPIGMAVLGCCASHVLLQKMSSLPLSLCLSFNGRLSPQKLTAIELFNSLQGQLAVDELHLACIVG